MCQGHKRERQNISSMLCFLWGGLNGVSPSTLTSPFNIIACFSIAVSLLFSSNLRQVYCAEANIDVNRLANSIFLAEGGHKTRHPYGILKKYKTTTPRQACINTINSNLKRYKLSDTNEDFISFMGRSYCPIGSINDPSGLNKNWVKNVRFYYKKGVNDV